MRRLTRIVLTTIAAALLAATLMPMQAFAAAHPKKSDIYVLSADGTNKTPISSSMPSGMSYNESSGTLTLTNYKGNGICVYGPEGVESTLKIVLVGTSTVTNNHTTETSSSNCLSFCDMSGWGATNLEITSTKGGTLNVVGDVNYADYYGSACCMFVGGSLTISGNAVVNVKGNWHSTDTYSLLVGIETFDTIAVRDTAKLSVKLGADCAVRVYGLSVTLSGESTLFDVSTNQAVTIDLSGAPGDEVFGVEGDGASSPFSFTKTPSVTFKAASPFAYWEPSIDGTISTAPAVKDYLMTKSGQTFTYKPHKGVVIYRMYNTRTSEHLYTTRIAEYNSCGIGNYADWRQEGAAWQAPSAGASGAKPVYRLYNLKSGDHHYTTAVGERDVLLASGDWRDEGTAFWSGGDVAVYRMYNGRLKRGQHHYSTSAGERDVLVADYGWRDEGIGFYAVSK